MYKSQFIIIGPETQLKLLRFISVIS